MYNSRLLDFAPLGLTACSVGYRYAWYRYYIEIVPTAPKVSSTGIILMPYRAYRSVRYDWSSAPIPVLVPVLRYFVKGIYRYGGYTGVYAGVPSCQRYPVPVSMLYRVWKCTVPSLMPYRVYRSVRNGMEFCTGTGTGTGALRYCRGYTGAGCNHLPAYRAYCPVLVLMLYRGYRSVRYGMEVSAGTRSGGIFLPPHRAYGGFPVPVWISYRAY